MENDTNTHAKPLWDLIPILTERLEIYSTAISAANADNDIRLIAFLEECMQLTQQFKSQLNGVLAKEDRAFSEAEWTAGSLYAVWQELRPSTEAIARGRVMDFIEETEKALYRVFQDILTHTDQFAEDTTAMLKSQAKLQQEIVDRIKNG